MSRRPRNRRAEAQQVMPSVVEPRAWLAPTILAILLIATILAYWPALHGGLLWDDDAHVTRPDLRSLSGLGRIWFDPTATQQYYPLLHTAFWLEYRLWGEWIEGYHTITLMWHLISVTLLYSILRKLRVPGAFLASAIFALHPVMVESVAWISEQKNTLSAVFYLAAMRVYLEFDQSRRRLCYALALTLFVLGLLTKTVTATLPAALLVIFWWQRGTLAWKRDALPLMPFFVLGTIGGVVTAWVERTLIGASGADFELTLIERSLLAGRVPWFYLGNLIWPANLIFIYPRWRIDPAVWWQWLFPIATLSVCLGLWAVRRYTRGLLAGWLLFVGTLLPVLGFLNVYPFIFSYVADHFQYLASIGMIVPAAAGIKLALNRLSLPLRMCGIVACALLVGMLGLFTLRQCRMYGDITRLYEATIEANPDCWLACNNLGLELLRRGNQNKAIVRFQDAIRVKPNFTEAHTNLGIALVAAGQVEQGIKHYRESLQLESNNWNIHNNLGNALLQLAKFSEAEQEYCVALDLHPDDPKILNELAVTLMQMDRYQKADEYAQRALKINPDDAEAHNSLGLSLIHRGEPQQAIEQFQEALKAEPDNVNAHNNLGFLYANAGDTTSAVAHFTEAVRLSPGAAQVQSNLGEILSRTGRPTESVEHFQAALRLQPDLISGYTKLSRALAQANRSEKAIATAEKGIAIARSSGQEAAAGELEEWLQHYKIELRRDKENSSDTKPQP